MILLAFCESCTWEILPMLIGAWFLGWLFWYLFHKPKYQNKINNLTSNIGALQTAAHTASLSTSAPSEDFLRLSDELKSAQNLNQDFNTQLRNLRSELENNQHITAKTQSKIDHLNNLISSSKQNNLSLKTDVDQLRAELDKIKKQNIDLQQLLLNSESEKKELKETLDNQAASKANIELAEVVELTEDNNDNGLGIDYEEAVRNQFVEMAEPNKKEKKNKIIDAFEKKEDPNARIEITQTQPSYNKWLDFRDLKIVEGVGPKIESLLKEAGIRNWEDLSNTEPSTIQNILNEAGPRYRIHDPKSWPLQARLAFKNDWIVLINLQKEMGGGKVGSKDKSSRSKVEKLVMKAKGIKAYAPDDLKIIEGVGPKIEGLLKADGIKDWKDLAAAKPERIKAVLTAAGDRYRLADPATWPRQASLAARGNWEELKAYQDRLKGGIE